METKLRRCFSGVFAAVLWFSACNLMGAQENYQFRGPEGLAFDREDHLFVADRGNNVIIEFDENLQMVKKIGAEGSEPGQFREPTDVAFDSQKRMIVADSGNNRIEVFDREGIFLL